MIPDEVVERVREAADIVAIIGEHVELRRVGASWRGPCPFHQGTHRNFSVTPSKGIYHCFVCKESGDVFTFLQKRLGMDWPTAVKSVGERSGIEVRETDTRRSGPDPREPFWEVIAAAADYFRACLAEEELGRPARDYLALRRVPREAVERFGLGFAPRELDAMRGHLGRLGFDDERLLAAGLLGRREEGGELRPRFRNRLIFPILDAAGHPVGFGGRLLGPGEPKYLNSAESPVFSKGRLLYGLNWAKHAIRREDRVLVVEGYFDALRLMAAGIDAVVAPLGTALTEHQAALLRRYAARAYLLYDSDRAGLRATFRAGDELLRHGMAVQVVTLPEGEDPDSYVETHGSAALLARLQEAIDVFERKVQLLERAGWFADLQKKRRALDRLLPTLRATADALTREIYVSRTAEVSGVSKATLEREIAQPALAGRRTRPSEAPADAEEPRQLQMRTSDRRGGERRAGSGRRIGAERELVRAMLLDRERVDAIGERIGADELRDPVYREIFAALLAEPQAAPDALAARLTPDGVTVVEELLSEPDALVNPQKTIEGSLAQLRIRALREELDELDRMLPIAVGEEKDELMRRKLALRSEVALLGPRGAGRVGKSGR